MTARLVTTKLLGFRLFWNVTVYVIHHGKGPTGFATTQSQSQSWSSFLARRRGVIYNTVIISTLAFPDAEVSLVFPPTPFPIKYGVGRLVMELADSGAPRDVMKQQG